MQQRLLCNVCGKLCRKNQKFKQCSICKDYTHQKCTNISPRDFSCLTGPDGINPFTCVLCVVHSSTSVNSSQGEYTYQNLSILNSQLKSKEVGDLFILHLNIVSLVANFDEIKSFLSKTEIAPDFICISESRLKDKKIE